MSSKSEYKLSTEIFGHSSDVKAVTFSSSNNCLISCSRDRTTKLWTPHKSNAGYREVETFRGHKNYVACVCILTPTPSFPCGLILTGGYDKLILGFEPQSADPIIEHLAHEDAVCKLVCGNNENVFLSASWDKSVKCWNATRDGITCTMVYRGHSMAVWSVAILKRELIATASADKTINIYIADGPFVRKLKGHTDCVRDVVPCGDYEILSCSNDSTVKRWDVQTGNCLATICGHSNYVYGVSFFDGIIASCGEDSCVSIWTNGEKQTIELPSQTVWCTTVLPNKDVVTGSSDGVIRIFTTNPERVADNDTLAGFEANVNGRKKSTEKEIGGVQISSLPGVEALTTPGRSDGQTQMIREGEGAVCYSWSASDNAWTKVGDVISGSGGTQETSGKVLYNGKEYDYVFTVDVADDRPALKLPYNRTDDPYVVAQAFILEHSLYPDYLDQVANFIISNANSEQNGVLPNTPYVDPFTGASRYVPGSNGAIATNNSDVSKSSNKLEEKLFPLTSYITMEVCSLKNALDKLTQFNEKIADPKYKCNHSQLTSVAQLGDLNIPHFHQKSFELLKQLLLIWPNEYHFPLLDILRLAVRKEAYNACLCRDEELLNFVITNLQDVQCPLLNKITLFRLIGNMFCQKSGEEFIFNNREMLLQVIVDTCPLAGKNKLLQVAVNTVLANFAILFHQRNEVNSQAVLLMNVINLLVATSDGLALCRLLASLGTILAHCPDLKNVLIDDVRNRIKYLTGHDSDKVKTYASALLALV